MGKIYSKIVVIIPVLLLVGFLVAIAWLGSGSLVSILNGKMWKYTATFSSLSNQAQPFLYFHGRGNSKAIVFDRVTEVSGNQNGVCQFIADEVTLRAGMVFNESSKRINGISKSPFGVGYEWRVSGRLGVLQFFTSQAGYIYEISYWHFGDGVLPSSDYGHDIEVKVNGNTIIFPIGLADLNGYSLGKLSLERSFDPGP